MENPVQQGADTRSSAPRRYLKPIVGVLLLLAIATGLWLLPVKQYLVAVLTWTQSLGAWGPIFVTVFYVFAAVFFLPGSVLTLGAGFLFGLQVGFLAAWLGATMGACAAFLVGRTMARDWIAAKVAQNPKFAAVDEAVGKEGFKIVFLLRLSPVFPFNFINYALGLTRVSFKHYAFASAIGMIPGGFMYTYFGSAARSLTDVAAGKVEGGAAGQVFFWLGLAATVAVTVFVTRLAAKSLDLAQHAAAKPEASPEK
jgi:uncharacterized membrane protein YdjX (TVP38/TMEM64 family)